MNAKDISDNDSLDYLLTKTLGNDNEHQRYDKILNDIMHRDKINFINYIQNLFSISDEEHHFSDITFNFSDTDKKVHCHRFILAARSDYFKELFEENLGKEIEIKDLSYRAFLLYVLCIYGHNPFIQKLFLSVSEDEDVREQLAPLEDDKYKCNALTEVLNKNGNKFIG